MSSVSYRVLCGRGDRRSGPRKHSGVGRGCSRWSVLHSRCLLNLVVTSRCRKGRPSRPTSLPAALGHPSAFHPRGAHLPSPDMRLRESLQTRLGTNGLLVPGVTPLSPATEQHVSESPSRSKAHGGILAGRGWAGGSFSTSRTAWGPHSGRATVPVTPSAAPGLQRRRPSLVALIGQHICLTLSPPTTHTDPSLARGDLR